jgi:hypothetical protein
MNKHLNIVLVSMFAMLLAGCASSSGDRDAASRQTRWQQSQRQPQSHQARQKGSITGRVTEAGGLIAENGTPYRLNGAKAAELRDYTGQTVTVDGYLTQYEGERAIIVQNFQAEESSRTARSEQGQNQNVPANEQPSEQDTGSPNKSNYDQRDADSSAQ